MASEFLERERVPVGLEKVKTGIGGFDQITSGGLPRARTTMILGEAGSGKTVFALQTLVTGVKAGEPGIFVAFEESATQIRANAVGFGWNLEAIDERLLCFIDARVGVDVVPTGAFDISGLLAGVAACAQKIGARRIVFDAIDVVLSSLENRAAERRELQRLQEWIDASGLSAIVTSKTGHEGGHAARANWQLQFMSHAVVLLRHEIQNRVSLRSLRVAKYRGSGFSENEVPMTIGGSGIDVQASEIRDTDIEVWQERLSTGIARLDTMLDGGYLRGTSILIAGCPGTAKTTLAGSFVAASCARGERCLFVSFDEFQSEIIRNLSSVNVLLQPYVDNGLLKMYSAQSEACSCDEHFIRIRSLIEQQRPQHLVIDPFSSMIKASGEMHAFMGASHLLRYAKTLGITLLCTSLLATDDLTAETSASRVSTIADTWLHLSYVPQGGERNRALTIVKSRGTAHSNQIRELVLSSGGISLADVYTSDGEVLMGAVRWQKEQAERVSRERERVMARQRRLQLEAGMSELTARIAALQREVEMHGEELKALDQEQDSIESAEREQRLAILAMRKGAAE